MDLIIRRAALASHVAQRDEPVDIGIEDGRIVAVEPRLPMTARHDLDAAGSLVTPPFVDPHFHMDATLSYGLPRVNASGDAAGRHRAMGRTQAEPPGADPHAGGVHVCGIG